MSLSWSDGRISDDEKEKLINQKITKVKACIAKINRVLNFLANDADLQDDLTTPSIQVALQHWTGVKRLSPDEAEKFVENRRAMYVMTKLRKLQEVCQEAVCKKLL